MSDDGCTLCELPLSARAVENDDGDRFCCTGCREVYDTLAERDGVDADDVSLEEASDALEETGVERPDGCETTFLRVDGMHCPSCEVFIESAADGDGVAQAQASYITDTVRVDHDPDEVDEADLLEELSGLGYRAYHRDDPLAEQRSENRTLGRIIAGILFGMVVMFQYLTVIYPTYFGGLFYDERTAQFLSESLASPSGNYYFLVIAVPTTLVLLITGGPILKGAYVSLRTRSPNMDLLISIAALSAYAYSIVVILVGGTHIYFDVSVAIVVVVTVGNYYKSTVKREAMERLSDLTASRVEEARLYAPDGSTETVDVDDLAAGDEVLVRDGERIPVDGVVADGEATVDEAVVTGESLPVSKQPDDEVIGGAVVQDGSLVVAVGEDAGSSLERITDLVWNLQSSNHGIQQLADKLATIFVPLVLTLATVVTLLYLLLGGDVGTALLVGLTVLIVSCPCSVGLATPLAIASGVRESLERGIVVFDETVFERLREVDTVILDKTGTITTGEMTVADASGPTALFEQAALLERRSSHPIATAIAAEFAGNDDARADGGVINSATDDEDDTSDRRVSEFRSHANGVGGVVDGTEVLVGHPDLFDERGWTLPDEIVVDVDENRGFGRIPVVVGRDGTAEGVVVVGDEPREGWSEAIDRFADRNLEVVLLTGDDQRAAAFFEDHPGVDHVFADVPPEGKAETVARFGATGGTVMVGDGTNDAPALARADLGIAMGSGTALAADAADVAIVDDDLETIETIFELSEAAGRRVKQNIGWAFFYNGVAIPLAITGLLNPLFAAIAMVSSSLLVVANSSRELFPEE
ncbi:heavy metal translocating P-type ATPase [Natrialbaceae archaeon AArc-T1-2]|uniref:heavy metal translocating P-type ATPase n=1 Tax=Natrialbaceae archaeon AArc-T1-2 TaxID=3053904 RepID=UPI00255B10CC|nr:cation-translocating P-type ATPase [Natrialbaceae archaeon AArc-T1-2]WIV66156.1 cation-translocating P-type ATPase [Natrialbaceae archaeon AArc-T1-2]